jgi:hypothetical protein
MQKIQGVTLLIFGVFIIVSNACTDSFENYSRNPQDILAFSTDSLLFDTVLTTVHSPATSFMVYNPHKQPLLISSINLAGGENSNFKIVVDGFSGVAFNDVPIGAKDSLYVIVSIKPHETGEPVPTLINDSVVFITNSVQQKVVLQAYGQDVCKHQDMTLDKDTVLSNALPYLIYDSLVINEGITVEIQEGTTFYMGNDALVIVKGRLKINGTIENPVTFRGMRTDSLLKYSYDLIPGQWGGMLFDSTSYDNELNNARIRNGNFGMDFKVSDPSKEKIKMTNVVLTNARGTLISAVNCNMIAENCEFSNSRDYLLDLTGGRYRFTHCTIANYYPPARDAGWGNTNRETLSLSDTLLSEPYPVLGFELANSIIAGHKISVSIQEPTNNTISFQNCVFTGDTLNKAYIQYTDCIYKAKSDSLFQNIDNDRETKLIFDFGLLENSPARDVADNNISNQIPLDIKGINRLEDGQPDAGAYEFVPPPEDVEK